MKKYEIEINNEVYRVTVKELPADTDLSTPQSVDTATPATQSAPTRTPVSSGGSQVKAPMAGTIFKVLVSPGQAVIKGDVLIILEAMKMENEIVAPQDGVVGDIHISVNDSVQSDQLLLTL